jgi:hypothetical protein
MDASGYPPVYDVPTAFQECGPLCEMRRSTRGPFKPHQAKRHVRLKKPGFWFRAEASDQPEPVGICRAMVHHKEGLKSCFGRVLEQGRLLIVRSSIGTRGMPRQKPHFIKLSMIFCSKLGPTKARLTDSEASHAKTGDQVPKSAG